METVINKVIGRLSRRAVYPSGGALQNKTTPLVTLSRPPT